MIGQTFGHYRITAALGVGGMGEVYRAADTTLDREVAIKVLPAELAQDAERLARFEREAKLLASLNHPNIAHVYGFESATLEDGSAAHFLAMELVEGEDLAERLKRGAIPVDETLAIAKQVAEALEEAHDKGIVHRDLKPANVKLTSDGKVRVLDFGLAKAYTGDAASGSGSSSDLSQSPTLAHTGSQAGLLLGTAAYMSPEQARGKPVDKRADIWAFGVVLYEMLTGKPLFAGETVSDVLAGVLKTEVDMASLPDRAPLVVRQTLRRCLERDPRNRLHDIADARIALAEVLSGAGDDALTAAESAAPKARLTGWRLGVGLLAMLALGALGAVVATGAGGRGAASSAAPPIRATIDVAQPLELIPLDRAVALSPDGTTLALAVTDPAVSSTRLHLRSLDRLEMEPLAGTEGASYPFWSPDGRALGFFAGGKLKRIDLAGRIVRTLCEAPQGRGGAWSPRDLVVFAPGAAGPLSQVSAEGGAPAPFTNLARDGENQRLPHFLPDGRSILFWAKNRGAPGENAVYAFDPEKGETKKILDSETEARYLEPGYLAYVREENLIVQRFDARRLALTGSPQPIAAGVQYSLTRRFQNLDLVAGGRLVYLESWSLPGALLSWFDADGKEASAWGEPIPDHVEEASLSPDGQRAAVYTIGSHFEQRLQLLDLERGTRAPVGDPLMNIGTHFPAWSSDSEALAISAEIDGQFQLAWIRARVGETPRALTSVLGMEQQLGDLTPDGRSILFEQYSNVDKRGDLFLVDVDGQSPPRPFLTGPAKESRPRISPDGRWVVYASDISGRDALWVTDFPAASGRWQVSADLRRRYGWMGDDQLYWEGSDGRYGVATIRARGRDLDIGARRALFGGRVMDDLDVLDYSPTRRRFLVSRAAAPANNAKLIFVSDWRAALATGGGKP